MNDSPSYIQQVLSYKYSYSYKYSHYLSSRECSCHKHNALSENKCFGQLKIRIPVHVPKICVIAYNYIQLEVRM